MGNIPTLIDSISPGNSYHCDNHYYTLSRCGAPPAIGPEIVLARVHIVRTANSAWRSQEVQKYQSSFLAAVHILPWLR